MRRPTSALLLLPLLAAISAPALAQEDPPHPDWPMPMHTNPPTGYLAFNQNEWRVGDGDQRYHWDTEAWYGTSLDRLWFKSEGSLDTGSGELEDTEIQALYGHAVSSYFDLQIGARYDIRPQPSRGWAVLGVEGLAPMDWEVGAYALASDDSHYGARLEASYDLYLTQRLILQPRFEANLYTRNDPDRGIGAGLSDLSAGLRLRYEIRRRLAPYLGINLEKRYGHSADFSRQDGTDVDELDLVAGVRIWF